MCAIICVTNGSLPNPTLPSLQLPIQQFPPGLLSCLPVISLAASCHISCNFLAKPGIPYTLFIGNKYDETISTKPTSPPALPPSTSPPTISASPRRNDPRGNIHMQLSNGSIPVFSASGSQISALYHHSCEAQEVLLDISINCTGNAFFCANLQMIFSSTQVSYCHIPSEESKVVSDNVVSVGYVILICFCFFGNTLFYFGCRAYFNNAIGN